MFYQTTSGQELIYRPAPDAERICVPSGMYRVDQDSISSFFSPFEPDDGSVSDSFVPEASEAYAEVDVYLQRFCDPKKRAQMAQAGFVNKLSLLLYGPPGTGKTSLVMHLIQKYVAEYGGIGIYNPHMPCASELIETVQESGSDQLIFILLDEFDATVRRQGEAWYAALLDGATTSLHNVCILATTNRLGAFSERIVYRPSRFAQLIEVGFPSASYRVAFIMAKFPDLDPAIAEAIAAMTQGMSTDHTKDAAIMHIVHGMSVDEIRAANVRRQAQLRDAGIALTSASFAEEDE